ncbi:MAG: glutamate racemase [Clostridia bacterium]|nr:glutamate racemase [Clostridia bacterium]
MIGVFDSGMGGLTAVKEILDIMPDAAIRYFGDTGRVPYGSRSRETIIRYALQDARFLASQKVGVILVACGTVSSTAMEALRDELDIPVIGVVEPTAEAAVKATKNKKIGIIGTAATIASQSYVKHIASLDPDIETYATACPLFVPLVEGGFTAEGCQITELAAEHYLAPLREKGIDTLILGCTHYPIISDAIAKALPGVTLINSGSEAARALADIVAGNTDPTSDAKYYVSDSPEGFASAASLFLGRRIDGQVEKIDIENY